jgi:polysaccharide biosynthesis/export protein
MANKLFNFKHISNYHNICLIAAISILFQFSLSSCGNTKNLIYFNIPNDTTLRSITLPEDLVIQKNDILGITITSLSLEASAIFNTTDKILVNSDGNIQLPVLGVIKAAGLTKSELKSNITNELLQKKLLVGPTVNIQFLNNRIVMLGEVGHPGILPFTNERLSIVEAIGLAGDMPVSANKQNVLLIREENGRKIFRHLDLTSSTIFASPYFYLKSNDVVYVQPSKTKMKSVTEPRIPSWVTFGMTTLSFIIGITAVLLK